MTARRGTVAWVIDIAIAVAITVGLQVELWTFPDVSGKLLVAVIALPTTAALAFRCRFPLSAAGLALGGSALLQALAVDYADASAMTDVVVLVALYSLGANTRGRQARVGAGIVAAFVVGAFASVGGLGPHPLLSIVYASLYLVGAWAVGTALRIRRDSERRALLQAHDLERDQQERARNAIAEERVRIARDLHDIVGHAVSVIVVQARGGRRIAVSDPSRATEAFEAILGTGEQALAEMRRLVGLLREEDGPDGRTPTPSMAGLDALAEEVRAVGVPVRLTVDGAIRPLSPGVDVSAYRIVQEALTNVIRHAGPARATVDVHYGDAELLITVSDDGVGGRPHRPGGNGLAGIRERVGMLGGDLSAGPAAESGFQVRASLPIGDAA